MFTLSDSKKKIYLSKPLLTHYLLIAYLQRFCFMFMLSIYLNIWYGLVFLLHLWNVNTFMNCSHFLTTLHFCRFRHFLPKILVKHSHDSILNKSTLFKHQQHFYTTLFCFMIFKLSRILNISEQIDTLNRWQREMLT